MKKMLIVPVLVLLTGCGVNGSPLNNAHPVTKVDNVPADTRDANFTESFCRSSVHRQVDGIGGPSDPDYDGLFNDCMAKRGYVARKSLTAGANAAPVPVVNH